MKLAPTRILTEFSTHLIEMIFNQFFRIERKRRRNDPEIAQEGPELAQDPDPFHHMEDQDIGMKDSFL